MKGFDAGRILYSITFSFLNEGKIIILFFWTLFRRPWLVLDIFGKINYLDFFYVSSFEDLAPFNGKSGKNGVDFRKNGLDSSPLFGFHKLVE